MKKKNKSLFGILGTLVMAMMISGCSNSSKSKTYKSFEELNNANPIIGVEDAMPVTNEIKELIPNAKLEYYSDVVSAYKNVESGKWDAMATVEDYARVAIASRGFNISMLQGTVREFNIGLALSENTAIPDYINRVNDAIAKFKLDGTMDELSENWLSNDAAYDMPEYPNFPNAPTIRCATFGEGKPFTFYQGKTLKGHDVDLAIRIAKELNCNISFSTASFPSMLMGIETGAYDMIASNLFISEERQERTVFSDSIYQTKVKIIVRDDTAGKLEFSSLEDLNGKKIGIVTGTIYEKLTKDRLPSCKSIYYKNIGDSILGLQSGKVDGVVYDSPVLKFASSNNKGLGVLPEGLIEEDYSFITGKDAQGLAYAEEFNEWVKGYKSSGKAKAAYDFWTSSEEAFALDFESLPNVNGSINVATFYDARPAPFVYNGKPAGFPNEVIYEFAKDRGYAVKILYVDTDNFVTSIVSKKADFCVAFISYSEERAQNVTFTDSVIRGGVSIMVREFKKVDNEDLFTSIGNSFYKTFVKENRWQMILKGLGTTLLITLVGFIFANLFGALFCAMGMSHSKTLKFIAGIYDYFIQGTPMVVILMILFYIIFGSSTISGEFIAMLGFGIVSGASLAQMFKGGINSVDKGQKEASLALGFTRTETFIGIVVPQASRNILVGYFGELINLLKSTSIVGYIAVMDLTKMGDVIRSATFEAFFPLFAVALIYFGITAILLTVMHLIQKLLSKKSHK